MLSAKAAIAKKFSDPEHPINPNHVFLDFGCGAALFHAVSALCEEGDKLLVQAPGFPLFKPISENLNIELSFYRLDPDKNWEVDLEDLESKIDSKTKVLLVNNPSNPCGSCWSREH